MLSMDVLPGRERSILATGGDDGTVRLWDTRTGEWARFMGTYFLLCRTRSVASRTYSHL